jgi:hypothetical protein
MLFSKLYSSKLLVAGVSLARRPPGCGRLICADGGADDALQSCENAGRLLGSQLAGPSRRDGAVAAAETPAACSDGFNFTAAELTAEPDGSLSPRMAP